MNKKDNVINNRSKEWFTQIIQKIEEEFSKNGKIERHADLWMWPKKGEKNDKVHRVMMSESVEKFSLELDSIKNIAGKLPAFMVVIVYQTVKTENQENGLKNQEHVILLFETFGFHKKYIWDICRESGKLPWITNGREENYESGNLMDEDEILKRTAIS